MVKKDAKKSNKDLLIIGIVVITAIIVISLLFAPSLYSPIFKFLGSSSNSQQNQLLNSSSTILTSVYTTVPSQNSDFIIQTSFYNNSTIGDGLSTVIIPITILDAKTNEPLSVPVEVNAQTNIGSVSSECSASSACNITFHSPATLKTEVAEVSIDAGGTIKTIPITINPDTPYSLSLSVPNAYTLNGYTEVDIGHGVTDSVLVNAKDRNGNPSPDGTKIVFTVSPTNIGTLSNMSCFTFYGSCMINFTQSISPPAWSTVTIDASSYNATVSLQTVFVPKGLSLKLINPTLTLNTTYQENWSETATIVAIVTDANNQPVNNVRVGFWTYFNNFCPVSNICVTNSSGECSVLYNAHNVPNGYNCNVYAGINGTSTNGQIIDVQNGETGG